MGDHAEFDYDWLVIGSGFGGSVSALRLAEKGYSVGVLEAGRRFRDEDFARSTWDSKNFNWAPALGMRGILRMTMFKDIFIVSGAGVGGGSLVYANTLYRAAPQFYANPQWAGIADWESALKPHYDTAEYMLGVQTVPRGSVGQELLKEVGRHFGAEDTFRRTPCGVFFGKAGEVVADPYFGGDGPERTGCIFCGECMQGCRTGAKNTLEKNYLWFAEKRGVQIHPEREVSSRCATPGFGRWQQRLSCRHRAAGRLVRQAAARVPGARGGVLGRRTRHECSAGQVQAERVPAVHQ